MSRPPGRLPSPPPLRGSYLLGDSERAPYAAASGILRSTPVAVAIPADSADAGALVAWASRHGVPLTPRGAGTGMPGGNVGPGISVDIASQFASIGTPDVSARTIQVGAGATLAEVNEVCRPFGLHFPVDPSSGARCTFGGIIANNSGGPHSVRYGSARRWVREVEAVLANGSLVTISRAAAPEHPDAAAIDDTLRAALSPHLKLIQQRWPRVRKNASGYALLEYLTSGDLLDLLVGSEGTLALILSARVALEPVRAYSGLAVLEFTSLAAAGAAVEPLLEVDPATCEMLDRTFLELVRTAGADEGYPLRPGLEAILLVEMDGNSPEAVEAGLARVSDVAGRCGARAALATGAAERDGIWTLRRAASPIIAAQAGERRSMQFIEDSVVPVERLADYVTGLRSILQRHQLPAVIFGHAGDANLHVNPLVDVRTEGWISTLEAVLDEVTDLVVRLGGTLTGEHGDGRLRAPMLERVWGPESVALFRQVKQAFDPAGILNPGVILPLPGQRPFDAIDPA